MVILVPFVYHVRIVIFFFFFSECSVITLRGYEQTHFIASHIYCLYTRQSAILNNSKQLSNVQSSCQEGVQILPFLTTTLLIVSSPCQLTKDRNQATALLTVLANCKFRRFFHLFFLFYGSMQPCFQTPPSFPSLQATESQAGPGNEARSTRLSAFCCIVCISSLNRLPLDLQDRVLGNAFLSLCACTLSCYSNYGETSKKANPQLPILPLLYFPS